MKKIHIKEKTVVFAELKNYQKFAYKMPNKQKLTEYDIIVLVTIFFKLLLRSTLSL